MFVIMGVMRMNKKVLVAALIVAVAVLVGGYFAWQKLSAPEVADPPKSLGGELFEEVANPIKEKLPETNPFTEAETNPLDAVYKNPF